MKPDNNIYQLGQITFAIEDETPEQEWNRLLPISRDRSDDVHKIPASGRDVRSLMSTVLAHHSNCLWFDGACLISPEGKRILIAGGSGSGKSTASIALVLGFGWKLYSEDITLIDPNLDLILSFASPFSLKTGTLDLLQAVLGFRPGPIIFDEWLKVPKQGVAETDGARFDFVLKFDSATESAPLACRPLTTADFVRLILPNSNLIHKDRAPDKVIEYVGSGQCFRVSGGTLAGRLDQIFELCGTESVDSKLKTLVS